MKIQIHLNFEMYFFNLSIVTYAETRYCSHLSYTEVLIGFLHGAIFCTDLKVKKIKK